MSSPALVTVVTTAQCVWMCVWLVHDRRTGVCSQHLKVEDSCWPYAHNGAVSTTINWEWDGKGIRTMLALSCTKSVWLDESKTLFSAEHIILYVPGSDRIIRPVLFQLGKILNH